LPAASLGLRRFKEKNPANAAEKLLSTKMNQKDFRLLTIEAQSSSWLSLFNISQR